MRIRILEVVRSFCSQVLIGVGKADTEGAFAIDSLSCVAVAVFIRHLGFGVQLILFTQRNHGGEPQAAEARAFVDKRIVSAGQVVDTGSSVDARNMVIRQVRRRRHKVVDRAA